MRRLAEVRRRSSEQIAAEALRAQEWCLEHLSEGDQSTAYEQGKKDQRRLKQRAPLSYDSEHACGLSCSVSTPADAAAEGKLDASISACVPEMEQVTSEALVDVARRSAGLASALAAAQVVSSRAPTEAAALLHGGGLHWLQDVLARDDVTGNMAAAHRACYTLRVLLDACPPASAAHARAELDRSTLTRLLCDGALAAPMLRILRAHGDTTPTAAPRPRRHDSDTCTDGRDGLHACAWWTVRMLVTGRRVHDHSAQCSDGTCALQL